MPMKIFGQMRYVLICGFVVTAVAMSYPWKGNIVLGKDIETRHGSELTPTRLLMQVISSHTSRILDAIMIGDHDAVVKESNAVTENCEAILKNFFPEGGKVGEWFKETGKDPNKPEDIKAVKKDFEKYLKAVVDASKNIAETSKKLNIVETYKSFDAMLKNACFSCHEATRPKWPEWPDWMKISGG